MLYNTVSINDVIGRIIRATRIQDTAYIAGMHSWIPEALELFRLDQASVPDYEDLTISFHKSKLPSALIFISAVEYQGKRLPYGNSVKNIRTPQTIEGGYNSPQVWQSGVTTIPVPDGNSIYFGTLAKILGAPVSTKDYYQIEAGYIVTTFSDGIIRIYFNKAAVDVNGFPLIPDNGDLKEALYYYVRKKMIESGYEDKIFKWSELNMLFETHMERACAQITMPSPDMMEHRVNTFVRFMPTEDYYDNYFRVSAPEPMIDPMGTFGYPPTLDPGAPYIDKA